MNAWSDIPDEGRRIRESELDEADERFAATWHSVALFVMWVAFAACLAMLARSCAAGAHDWKNPNYDAWYGSLVRPHVGPSQFGSISCCSKTDCHETEAEIRGNEWWARLGLPHSRPDGGDGLDWELADWVKVPADKIINNSSNPTGNAVICHSIDRTMHGINPNAMIWCFVPPSES